MSHALEIAHLLDDAACHAKAVPQIDPHGELSLADAYAIHFAGRAMAEIG